jgi:hypothetical protein
MMNPLSLSEFKFSSTSLQQFGTLTCCDIATDKVTSLVLARRT